MSTQLESRDRDFVRTLQGLGSASVAQLCEQLAVTATSVRQRLNRLEALGLVERDTVKAARGRPVHQYRVSDEGLRQLGSNYGNLAVLLWSEFREIEHQPTRKKVFEGLKNKLVSRFGSDGSESTLEGRVGQLAEKLTENGLDVEVSAGGVLPVLQGCSCPYPDISKEDSSICELEREVFSEVLGAEVELLQRCVDGHSCCEFSVSEKR